jgi:predicted transglutaminase-like cysteine proteinase
MEEALKRIFDTVHDNFIWKADRRHELTWREGTIKLKDHWDLMEPDENDVLRGDCEDFALYCSKMIRQQLNIPKEDRKLTYCLTETKEGHMVLSVTHEGKNYVFDNRQRKLTTLNKLKRSGYKHFAQPETTIIGKWVYI